ncbi:hypothetical protein [Gayadomonas joobiniege]|uniref:hypothetical protein n=1 Tax=Gayadomonas joobiniege TaxID=1234606 RepID=UPI000360E470|nr:hypothetical protein [Gayadomonas joobiniege]
MKSANNKLNRLVEVLSSYPKLAIAVSGGIDSMLLMYITHHYSISQAEAVHAYSAAVPSSAYALLDKYTQRYQWSLTLIDAKELADPQYQKNPLNRCYYCKTNLYQRIAEQFKQPIASGTNLDDLTDFRPGLKAAKEHNVVQPYVEAGISKTDIYQMASELNLTELQDLPAQPCLASRVETGIMIEADKLTFIDQVEESARFYVGSDKVIRCRLTQAGVILQLSRLPTAEQSVPMLVKVRQLCESQGLVFLGVEPYQKGSAFIHSDTGAYYAAG